MQYIHIGAYSAAVMKTAYRHAAYEHGRHYAENRMGQTQKPVVCAAVSMKLWNRQD